MPKPTQFERKEKKYLELLSLVTYDSIILTMTKTDFVCAMVCGLMAAATLTGAAPSAAREAIAVLQLDPNAQLVKSNQPDLTIIEAHPTFGPNTGGMLGGADIFVSDPTVRHRYDCVPALTMYSFGTWMPVSYEVNPYQYKGCLLYTSDAADEL